MSFPVLQPLRLLSRKQALPRSPFRFHSTRMRINSLLVAGLVVLSSATLFAQEQAPPKTTPADSAPAPSPALQEAIDEEETEVLRAMVRVSWKLIDRLADDQINADIPFQSSIMGGSMSGRVRSKADITVELREHEDYADFYVQATGTAQGNFNATRDSISLSGPMSIPFTATQPVHFNGRQFVAEEPTVEANVNVRFQCISRSGLFPNLGRRIVANAAERERPSVQRSAEPIAKEYLVKFVNQETKSLVAQLNQVTDVEKSILKIYPQLKDWKVQLCSTQEHVEARYAPPGSPRLELPIDPRRPENAGIEIWIRTTAAEAKLLERISGWDQSQQLLKTYMQGHSVDVASMASDAKVVAIDDWVVVAIGMAIEE
jgi:hypothetical protein